MAAANAGSVGHGRIVKINDGSELQGKKGEIKKRTYNGLYHVKLFKDNKEWIFRKDDLLFLD